MHLTPKDLKRLAEKWLDEGWPEEVVRGTISGMQYDILARRGNEWLSNAGAEKPTTPTNANT
jgi:hypothetical protein